MEYEEIIPRCERTDKHGFVITLGDGSKMMVGDEDTAFQIYRGIKGEKSLCACEGGYVIPLLSQGEE